MRRPSSARPDPAVTAGVRATYAAFISTGFIFASWASRIPQVRDELRLDPARLGLVLLAIAVGSLVSLPLSGTAVGRYGSRRTVTFMALVNNLPNDCVFSAFSIGRMQIPFVAMAALAGGNVRVGLEDNLYLGPGHKATNAELVARAKQLLESMNVRILGPQEVRDKLKLVKH